MRREMIVFEEEFADGDKKICAVPADLFDENEIYDFFWGGYVPDFSGAAMSQRRHGSLASLSVPSPKT